MKPMKDDEEETEPVDNPEEEVTEGDKPKGKKIMMNDTQQVDTYDAKAEVEKLTAQLNQKQEEFAAQLKSANDRANELSEKLSVEQKSREIFAFKQEAESFTSLAIPVDEYADTMYLLNKTDPKLAKWVKEKFAQFDTMISQGALFSQISRTVVDQTGVETLETLAEKILAEEFSGDKTKYAEALILADKRNKSLIPPEMRSRRIRQ